MKRFIVLIAMLVMALIGSVALAESLQPSSEGIARFVGSYMSGSCSLEVTAAADGKSVDMTVNVNLNVIGEQHVDGYEEWHMNAVWDEGQGRLTYEDSERTTYIQQQEAEKKSGGAGWFEWNEQERSLSWTGCSESAFASEVFTAFDPDDPENQNDECEEDEQDYAVFTAADGTVYDDFVITKLNCDADHKVVSVTGHYERVVIGEECDEPEAAENSEVTYALAENFTADMLPSMMADSMDETVAVTDLYQWYIDAYIGRDSYDGHDLVFECDLTNEQKESMAADFWFVTTRIELNEKNEIIYMVYQYVPWG